MLNWQKVDFKRRAKEIISAYYDKDGIEKAFCCMKQPIGLRPIRHWLDGRVSPHIYMLPLISIECVVTNPKGGISTAKLSIPSRVQRQIMDVLGIEYIKSET